MIDEDVTYEQWENIGYELARVGKGWQWWVGDWINFGEKKYGETYKAAIEATGLAYGVCRNIASVCGRFELSRRHDSLSFKHHAEVQGLDASEQDELLAEAESSGLSCSEVRKRVRAIKQLNASDVDRGDAEEIELEEMQESGSESLAAVPHVSESSVFCVSAFRKAENRLEAVKLIISELEPHERLALIELLRE